MNCGGPGGLGTCHFYTKDIVIARPIETLVFAIALLFKISKSTNYFCSIDHRALVE